MRLLLLLLLTCTTAAQAQWQTTVYNLKGGWNSIHLSGDATYGSIDELFPNSGVTANVLEVWRWNPNPTQMQFTASPLIPSAGTPEWSVWRRGVPADTSLSVLTGQAAYLVKCAGTVADTYTVSLKQSPNLPGTSWVRNGANLLGFPTTKTGGYPSFANYFATFPAAIAANSKIYKYVGGELGPSNPQQVFSPISEPLDRTQAYWFSAKVVNDFYAPLEISLSKPEGLAFGRTGSAITALVRNRTSAPVTLTLATVDSESAPQFQTAIASRVPLTRRTFNSTTLQWTDSPMTSAYTEVIGPQSTVELNFGINRADATMVGAADGAFFASFLRLTDSGNLMDVYLPATASKASLAGLWIGDAEVSAVTSKVPGSPGATTPRPFPLRLLLHVNDTGSARLLSQVFLGQLAASPNAVGIATQEVLLKQDSKATAQRLVAAHLPLDQVINASGTVSLPGTITCNVTVPYNDPTNPFGHQYHPDHDNRNARFEPITLPPGVTPTTATMADGVEAPAFTRTCTFTFTTAPPPGSGVTTGWGSRVIGGIYAETITGVHKEAITVGGTFELRRASEIGTLTTP